MSCTCQIDISVDEYCTLLSSSMPKARKQHTCYECKRIIGIGEIYKRESTVYDGWFDLHKTCLDCLSIREHILCGWYYGHALEDVEIAIEEGVLISEDCISKLTPSAREWVCELIEKQWQ